MLLKRNDRRQPEFYRRKILERYPGNGCTVRLLRDIEMQMGHYSRLSYDEHPPAAGDICLGVNRGIRIPDAPKLDSLLSSAFDRSCHETPVEIADDYLLQVHKRVPHVIDALNAKGLEQRAVLAAFFRLNDGLVIDLEDVIMQKLPALCFEQALTLTLLLNRERSLLSGGSMAYLQGGEHCRKIHRKVSAVPHAWVKLKSPYLNWGEMLLDPTYGDKMYYRKDGSAVSKMFGIGVVYYCPAKQTRNVEILRPRQVA